MLTKVIIFIALAGFVLTKQIPVKSNFITSDIFNKIYVVSKSDLQQFNENGDVINTYSSKNMGDISYVDATNPMRILLFYVHFNQIVFLNNKLSPLTDPICLDDLGFTCVGSACSSSQNGFWIFDTRNNQLVLISSSLQVVYKGNKIILPDSISSFPIYLSEQGKNVFVAFQNYGLYVLNQTGSQEKFIPIEKLQYLQVIGSKLFYLAEGNLKRIDLVSMNVNKVDFENQPFYGFTFLKDKIVIADSQQLRFYSIE